MCSAFHSRQLGATLVDVLTIHQELLALFREQFRQGETVIEDALGLGPHAALIESRHPNLDGVYIAVAKWDAWVAGLDALLRTRVAQPDHLLKLVERRLSSDQLLRFSVHQWRGGVNTKIEVDLGDRARWNGRNSCQELRTLLASETVTPTWNEHRQALLDSLRQVRTAVEGAIPTLGAIGEPSLPSLELACQRLAHLPYVDVGTTKKHAVDAETDFKAGRWKPASAVARPALEQIIGDAYDHLRQQQPGLPSNASVQRQCEELGRAGSVSMEAQRFCYGVYALLSEIGNHPGDVPRDDGERGFHAFLVAISLLSAKLK